MNRRIILWDSKQHTSQASDEAGTTIVKSILPPTAHICGPYETKREESHVHVPSLASLALKSLLEYPEQVHALGLIRLRYQGSSSSHDTLRELIPWYDPEDPDFTLSHVDPRLWATIIQVFSDLPITFKTYRIPLSDKHVTLLQQIPSTPHFSLITILNLSGCSELSDETIGEMKHLPGLCALDASGTKVSSHGIRGLSRTLMWTEDGSTGMTARRGPWALRILDLRNCKSIDDSLFSSLAKFVLLSIVDLRGTKCSANANNWNTFRPTPSPSFFHPSPLSTSLDLLSSANSGNPAIFSSSELYYLHISSLHHKADSKIRYSSVPARIQARRHPTAMEDAYVVFPPSQSYTKVKQEPGPLYSRKSDVKPRIVVGNSNTLARKREARENAEKHERNKEAWYERNEHLLERNDWPTGSSEYLYDHRERWLSTDEESVSSEDEDSKELYYRPRMTSGPTSRPHLSTRPHVSPTSRFNDRFSRQQPPASSSSIPYTPAVRGTATAKRRPQATRPIEGHPLRPLSSVTPSLHTAVNPDAATPTAPTLLSDPDSASMQNRRATPVPRPEPPTLTRHDAPSSLVSGSRAPSRHQEPVRSHPVPLDINIQGGTSQEEAQIFASPQPATSFYLSADNASGIRQQPVALRARTGRSRPKDVKLMLFREPPPWSILDSLKPVSAKSKQCVEDGAVVVKQLSTKGTDGVRELTEMVKRRKLVIPDAAARAPDQMGAPATPIPRNPFRRRYGLENVLRRSPQKVSGHEGDPALSLPATRPSPRNDVIIKPLKPISSLAIPTFPDELRPRAKMDTAPPQLYKHSNALKESPAKLTHDGSLSKIPIGKSNVQKLEPDPKLHQNTARTSAQRGHGSIKVSGGMKRRNKPTEKITLPAFDWKGWGNSSGLK